MGEPILWLDYSGIDVPPYTRYDVHEDEPRDQTTGKRGRVRIGRSEEWERLQQFFRDITRMTPRTHKRDLPGPLQMRFIVWRERLAADGDNLQKSIWDALQNAGVIHNDRSIRNWTGTTMRGEPRLAVELNRWQESELVLPDWLDLAAPRNGVRFAPPRRVPVDAIHAAAPGSPASDRHTQAGA